MNLVIVESPSKTKTIKQYLGKEYDVVATKGHIRDIKNCGEGNLGLDFNNNYKPIYEIIPKQYSTVKMLNEAVSVADNIYLATDPDREGEAISWHLNETLRLGSKVVKRIEFNEITEQAIKDAISNPRDIDDRLFHSQETRKIMDRVIGFKLSSLVKKTIGGVFDAQTTAGRVQSACLKMITDREKKIKAFVPETYYDIEVDFGSFKAKLVEKGKREKKVFTNKLEAESVLDSLTDNYIVSNIELSQKYERPGAPFTTSSLMQAALNRYNLNSKKTMKVAQELYEGIEVNGKHIAFITYMRTDSTRLSEEFKKKLYFNIKETFGEEYCGYLHQGKLAENAQDAHEAIRPVSLKQTKEWVKEFLNKDQFQIYSLIYDQAVESMMKDALIEVKTVTLSNGEHEFIASFDKTLFDGFKKNRKPEKEKEFKYELGDSLKPSKEVELNEKQTEGPKRFTEATIIKEMENTGIGRPSTYASTIDTLKTRKYISIVNRKEIEPSEKGILVSNYLDEHFNKLINVEYTAEMEKELDEIAEGNKNEEDVIPDFYTSFIELFKEANSKVTPLETGEICPKCGSKMVYRSNKFGSFEACSNYPSCKYIKKQEIKQDENAIEIECPECKEGHLVMRVAKTGKKAGKTFYACSCFPKCHFTISSLKEIGKK